MLSLAKQFIGFYKKVKAVAAEQGKKPLLMTLDIVFCHFILGSSVSDYMKYEFYRRGFQERRSFATYRVQNSFYSRITPQNLKRLFDYKPEFMRVFHELTGRGYFTPAEGSLEEFEKFLAGKTDIMVKPHSGSGGYHIYKQKVADIPDLRTFYEKLRADGDFVEEVLHQHAKLNELCPACINTIRVMTANTDGNPRIFFAALRIGNGEEMVDNFHNGGMGVAVDVETGILRGKSVDMAARRLTRHPVTGMAFEGFALPCWQEVRTLVDKACRMQPEIRVVGWDVALTPDGPVLVEGNRRPGFDLPQALCDKGLKGVIKDISKACKASRRPVYKKVKAHI